MRTLVFSCILVGALGSASVSAGPPNLPQGPDNGPRALIQVSSGAELVRSADGRLVLHGCGGPMTAKRCKGSPDWTYTPATAVLKHGPSGQCLTRELTAPGGFAVPRVQLATCDPGADRQKWIVRFPGGLLGPRWIIEAQNDGQPKRPHYCLTSGAGPKGAQTQVDSPAILAFCKAGSPGQIFGH